MTLRFLRPAADELAAAVAHYDQQGAGLGDRFLDAVQHGLDQIGEWPHAWQAVGPQIRRYLLNRFPYALIYALDNDEIIVIAVANLHRRPDYWRGRWPSDAD